MRSTSVILALAASGLLLAGCTTGEIKSDTRAAAPAAPAAPAAAPDVKLSGPYQLDSDGYILNWLIVGPFPNPGQRPENKGFFIDYLKDGGGEEKYTPASGMEIKGGGLDDKKPVAVKWQPYASSESKIDFFSVPHMKLEAQQDCILTYSACWIESEKDQDVEVKVGSDDAYKLWIDHKHINDVHEYRAAEPDQETYKLHLAAGKKTLILIKVDQDTGGFEFYLRIAKGDKKAPGIKVWN
jgi:hypothetical protein